MSQNSLLVCADLKGLSLWQRGISTPNKVLTMRNFIPQQGNLKLVGFVARTPMRSTDQVRHMLAYSPVICRTLKHFTWAVGEQGTPQCICNSALRPVSEAHLRHTYTREQLYQPHPWNTARHLLQPHREVCRARMILPAKKKPSALSLLPALPLISPLAVKVQRQMERERHQHASAQRDLWSGVVCRLPRKTWLSRQKGLRKDASSDEISQRNNSSSAKC